MVVTRKNHELVSQQLHYGGDKKNIHTVLVPGSFHQRSEPFHEQMECASYHYYQNLLQDFPGRNPVFFC